MTPPCLLDGGPSSSQGIACPLRLQPEEELVEDESGALDADVGAVFTVTVSKGSKSLV